MRHAYFRLLDAVAPPLSIRRQFLALSRQVPGVLRSEGLKAVGQRTRQAFRRYRDTGSLIIPDPTEVVPGPQPEPPPYPYAEWIAANEPDAEALARLRELSARLEYQPLISIVVPVHNPPADVLAAAIESVLAQTYPNWQLCIADGASTDQQVTSVLHGYADDERIAVASLPANLGISGNSNAALDLAKGEFVALLDHDDTLAPTMLFEVASLLNRYPETDIVYFDEDKLTAGGSVREQPWFKPDYSPDLMLSTNLLMHAVYRRSLLLEAGAFDPATDGAQDWDLALRCTRRTGAIRHIPSVLYHWRQVPGSASVDAAAKPWAFAAQVAALERHLEQTDGRRPVVEFPSLGRTRIVWPETKISVSIIIPTKDKLSLLRACLDSIFTRTDYADYEVVLVDTGSVEQGTRSYYDELLAQRPNVKLVELPGPFNYSRANNAGAVAASGHLLLFLNNDTEVLDEDWLRELAGWASRPGVGIVGAKLLRPNGLIQHAGIVIGLAGHGSHVFEDTPEDTYGVFGSTEWYRNYHAVTGACMMVPAKLFRQLGGFDEVYQVGYSDVEFCLRAGESGYRTVYTPFARLLHKEGSSRGFYVPPSDVLRASCQMLPLIRQGDRHFNPNLSLHYRKPTLDRPGDLPSTQTIVDIMRAYGLLPPHLPGITAPIVDIDLPLPRPWPETQIARRADSLGDDLSILLVSHDLSRSGAPLLLASLAAELAATGMRLTVISPEDGPVREDIEAAGVPVQIAPSIPDSFHDTSLLTRLDIAALTRAIGNHDLVVANSIVTSMAVNAATAFNVPSLYWLHESHFGHDTAVRDASVRAALLNATRIILPTHYLAELYGDLLPRERTVEVPHGLDEATLVPEPGGVSLPPHKVNVVIVGSVEPRKGQDFLLSSVVRLPDSVREQMEFYFLGRDIDPAFAGALHAQSDHMSNIHWEGNLARAQVMSYLDGADVFVLSSRDEVLPVSLLEAMYHSLAVIATRVGCVPDVIQDGENGLLVDFDDQRGMARALERLAVDPHLRAHMGEAAARTARERFGMHVFVNRFADLIADATASNCTHESGVLHT